ncbi:molybdopterin-dependent oxidoreductase [Sciscionella sediminilitoris]|uniref:molybdopterin-dependent oxidoreductase n=1 Tax=Sciscionella sediminilitoris TaxID=1445613 RepID=UPI0004DF5B3B|nr:molybdopterin-dependent oxidoreductase [Sciscionella sp. SE31]
MTVTVQLAHWGAFEAESDGKRLTEVRPWRADPAPSPILGNIASAQHHPARIDRPHIRKGWLDGGPGPAERGGEEFVPVSWHTALDLLAGELRRVYAEHGPRAVYGGSYGWSSAGRFHHAQSQVHRFLNTLGGYVRSEQNYSYGASGVLVPRVLGSMGNLLSGTSSSVLARHTELFVAFGGLSPKNSAVAPGGIGRHDLGSWLSAAHDRGCRFVSLSPLRDDTFGALGAEWLAPIPGSDTALMLAIAHVLETEDLCDREFLARCTVGYERFAPYLADKTPEWAERVTGIPAGRIRSLAREMAASRTLISVSWSLQRQQYGEQPVWMGIVLAAMLGQFGLPGGGFGHGYGSTGDVGKPPTVASAPRLSQGTNPVEDSIPVARIADMLLHPGQRYEFDGQHREYPDIRLVYWAGGNPFHHHQDLARLRRAFGRPDTVVVHDPFWTASARHADIVLPTTMAIERDDYGSGGNDPTLFPMPALTEPAGQARDDYTVFAELAGRLGVAGRFTEGRTAGEWLRHLYQDWRDRLATLGHELPGFDEFWSGEPIEVPLYEPERVLLADFRADPQRNPLRTPSGRIEIYSETIAGFGYPDCQGHPMWFEPEEWHSGYPLHLIANQPRTRLHSQLDVGEHSRSAKVADREPVRMHPADAEARGLREGEPVLLHNARGRCLAGLVLSEEVAPGVVQLSTGAWYDPDPEDPAFCGHGNPNVLTADRPTSTLAQACTGQHAMVEVSSYDGEPPPLRAHSAPERPGG